MGGSVSKERTYTYQEILDIPRCAILAHWAKEDQDFIEILDKFIDAKFFGNPSEKFPTDNFDEFHQITLNKEDVLNIDEYQKFLDTKILTYQGLIKAEEETKVFDESLKF